MNVRKSSPQICTKHGTLLFADQDDVDNFVNSYGKAGADMEQVCT